MPEYDSQIQKVLDQIRVVGRQVPAVPCVYPLREPVFGIGTSQADIASLERAVKVPLPQDFWAFQRVCGSISAMDVWNGYSLFEASHIQAIIEDAHAPKVIQATHGQVTMVPIGGDGGGNMFLLAFAGSNHVSKWNHEIDAQINIADSFIAFLERMLKDWQHFVTQDGGWKYMSG